MFDLPDDVVIIIVIVVARKIGFIMRFDGERNCELVLLTHYYFTVFHRLTVGLPSQHVPHGST